MPTPTEIFYGLNYAAQVGSNGPIKIGYTTQAASVRVSQLQQASPYPIRLIGQWPATLCREQTVHADLADFRIRAEWYHPVTPVMDRIAAEIRRSLEDDDDRLAWISKFMGGRDASEFSFASRAIIPAEVA